jgi:hypothetical protein
MISNQSTRLQMFLEGPGTLDFWWKASSEPNYDFVSLVLDGQTNRAISGEVVWQQQSVNLWRPGLHDVSWIYSKDSSVDDGLDAGWVDEIQWTPIPMDRDTDTDGQFDWQEGMAGTDIGDSNSLFQLERPLTGWRSPGGGIVLEWQSSAGIYYVLERTSLMGVEDFYNAQIHIEGTAGRTQYEDIPAPEDTMFFYRVRVEE